MKKLFLLLALITTSAFAHHEMTLKCHKGSATLDLLGTEIGFGAHHFTGNLTCDPNDCFGGSRSVAFHTYNLENFIQHGTNKQFILAVDPDFEEQPKYISISQTEYLNEMKCELRSVEH